MRRTTDPAEIEAVFRVRYPEFRVPDYALNPKTGGMFIDDDGQSVVLIRRSPRRGFCSGWMTTTTNHGGIDVLATMMDKVAHWLFANTDTIVIHNRVPPDATAVIKVMQRSKGRVDESNPKVTRHTYTIVRWAKHIGPQNAIDLLRANGLNAKADRLEARWNDWQARQP